MDIQNFDEINEKRQQRLEMLHKHITDKSTFDKNVIKVFSIEAAGGKTTQIIESLKFLAKNSPDVKTLIVTKFIEEGETIVKKLGKKTALAINSKSEIKLSSVSYDLIKDINVVVITHQAYKMMCYETLDSEVFLKGRTNLIIDEELNLVQIHELSDRLINNIRDILSKMPQARVDFKAEVRDTSPINVFNRIINRIKNEKDKFYSGTMRFFYYEETEFDAPKAIDELVKMINWFAENNNAFWKNLKRKNQKINTSKKLIDSLFGIKSFYNNKKVIAYNSTLFSYNDTVSYCLLDNNLLLDASAPLKYIYRISPIFQLHNFERIEDHSKWTMHVCKINSSSFSKLNSKNFYSGVMQMLDEEVNKGDKVLVLLKEEDKNYFYIDFFESLKNKQYEFSNFENMRGKNTWGDFNKCFIIHTPQLAAHYYIFEYLYYNPQIELNDDDIVINRVNKHMCFKNEELEKVKTGDIICNIYQGIKRIHRERDLQYDADVYLFNNNDSIIDVLKEQFSGINIKGIDLSDKQSSYPIRKRRYNSTKRKRKSLLVKRVNSLIEILKDDSINQFKKSDLRQKLGNINRKSFSRIMEHKKIIKFFEDNGFVIDKSHCIYKKLEE